MSPGATCITLSFVYLAAADSSLSNAIAQTYWNKTMPNFSYFVSNDVNVFVIHNEQKIKKKNSFDVNNIQRFKYT